MNKKQSKPDNQSAETELEQAVSSLLAQLNTEDLIVRNPAAEVFIKYWDNPEIRSIIQNGSHTYSLMGIISILNAMTAQLNQLVSILSVRKQYFSNLDGVEQVDKGLFSVYVRDSASHIELRLNNASSIVTEILHPTITSETGTTIEATELDETFRAQGDFEEAFIQFALALSSAYHAVGVLQIDAGAWYEGLTSLEGSLGLRRSSGDIDEYETTDARADTIYQIARVHHLIGNLDKARMHYRDALRLYQHTENEEGTASCQSALGHLMTQMGYVDDAISNLKSAKRLYRRLGNANEVNKVDQVLKLATKVKEKQPA